MSEIKRVAKALAKARTTMSEDAWMAEVAKVCERYGTEVVAQAMMKGV